MQPPPRDLRDTLELLSRLDTGLNLDRLVEQVDWQGVTPQQISCATLGRLPQDIHYAGLAGTLFDPAAYFKSLLLCPEFQSGIVTTILNAFPEKPRKFFVHVPRCGGTSVGQTLAAHTCTIHYNNIGPAWCSGHAFLHLVGGICRKVSNYDAIHVSGHYTLRFLIDGRLARSGDSVWTSVRAPQEIILSYINYILTMLELDPDLLRADTRVWARQLCLDGPPSTLRPDGLRAVLERMIQDDTLLPRNLLCHFLGDGTAASALDLLAAADVEVIDTARLDQWRERRWNIPAQPRANVSTSFLRWNDLDHDQRRQLGALIRQDTTLHRVLAASLGSAVSVGGMQIARTQVRPLSSGGTRPRRVRRATRPILLDADFANAGSHGGARPGNPGPAWSDPPLNYRTIETTLQFPMIQTRIRVRYARRKPGRFGFSLRPWLGRLGMIFAR